MIVEDKVMFNEGNVRIISLDTESRVRGICQLMDGIIFDLYVMCLSSQEDVSAIIHQFSNAMDYLDYYLLLAYGFIEKYRLLKKIDESEVKKYHSIVEKKRNDVAKVIKKEYEMLDLPRIKNLRKKR
jgi:hypothetical protein